MIGETTDRNYDLYEAVGSREARDWQGRSYRGLHRGFSEFSAEFFNIALSSGEGRRSGVHYCFMGFASRFNYADDAGVRGEIARRGNRKQFSG